MADTKISALPAVTDVQDADAYVLARAGATQKITGANLKAAVASSSARVASALARKMADFTAIGAAVTFTNAASTGIASGVTYSPAAAGTATTVSGSPNLTAVTGGPYVVGDYLRGSGIPAGAKITAYNSGAGTMTISGNATASASGVAVATPSRSVPWRYNGCDIAPFLLYTNIVVPLDPYSTAQTPPRQQDANFPMLIEVDFDGQAFEILMDQFSTAILRVWANETVSADFTVTASGAPGFTKVDFGSRAYRRVTIEIDNKAWFGGLRRAATDSFRKPTYYAPAKFAVVGDSYSQGGGANASAFSARAYPWILTRLLGFTQFRMYGRSGTGIIATGSDGNYRTRITDVTTWAPDVLLVQGSTNDGAQTAAAVQTELSTYLTAIFAALPNVKVFVTGILHTPVMSAQEILNNAGIAAACAGFPGVTFIDTYAGADGPWLYGTGRVGTTTGDGNADFYQSSIVTGHPSLAGHDYIARAIAPQIAAALGMGI